MEAVGDSLLFPSITTNSSEKYNLNSEAKICLNPSIHPDTINNNLEFKIVPSEALTKFTRRLILLFMGVQTFLLFAIAIVLCIKINNLEVETVKVSAVVAEKELKLLNLSIEVNALKAKYQQLTSNYASQSRDGKGVQEYQPHYVNRDEDGVERLPSDLARELLKFSEMVNRSKLMHQGSETANHSVQTDLKQSNVSDVKGVDQPSLPTPTPEITAVHLKGGLPEILIKEKGTIGPWFQDDHLSSPSDLKDFKLEPLNSSVEILSDGFYFIYAQVYYLTSGGSSSFSILKYPPDESGNREEILSTCSSGSAQLSSRQEVSCFTATAGKLKRGDRLQLRQREINRRVLFRPGQTYFGLMKMSSMVLQNDQTDNS